MSPKREENPVPCWILNILETVSNQWQGCFQGADEKYSHLIILAWKWIVGKRKEEINQVLQDRDIWTSWEGILRAPLRILSLFLSCFFIAFGMNHGFPGHTSRAPHSEENKQIQDTAQEFFILLPPNPKVIKKNKKQDYILCISLNPVWGTVRFNIIKSFLFLFISLLFCRQLVVINCHKTPTRPHGSVRQSTKQSYLLIKALMHAAAWGWALHH